MNFHRNLSLILACAFALGGASLAWAQSEALPANLGSTCPLRQANANKIRQGLRDEKVPGVCRQEVQKQYEACNLHPEDDNTGADIAAGPATIRNGAEAQRDRLRIAATRNTAKARLCGEARARVREVCGQLNTDLRNALDDNSRGQRREINDLNASQAQGSDRVRREYEIIRRYSGVARELQEQRTALDRFRHLAETVIEDNARCYADIARRDTFDAERSNEVLASASSDGPAPQAVQTTAVRGENPPVEAGTGGIVEGVRGQATSEAGKAAVRGATATTFGSTSWAAAGTRAVAGAATGLVGLGTAGIGIFLGSTTSAGHACDMVYLDALSADAAGCRVLTRQSIQSLGSQP
jgi:hypothetical protein